MHFIVLTEGAQFGRILSIHHMITNSSVQMSTHWTLIYGGNLEVLSIQYDSDDYFIFFILLNTPSYISMKINNIYSIVSFIR